MQRLLEKIREILRNRRTRRLFSRAVSLVAAFLVFVTTYALVLPAITMEKTASCGMDEHQHSDSCYESVLICGQEESEGHHHDDSCYTVAKELNCQLEEHRHSREAGCYDEEGNLICQLSEHTHDDSCYREVKTLTCGREESEGHHHTDACYEKVLVCGKEVHTHSEACYKDGGNAGETNEEAADQASSVSMPEDSSGEKTAEAAAEEKLSENDVPKLDALNMEAVFGKETGFYYFHAGEGQEVPSNSTEITDWRRVKEDTKLAPTDLVKMYLPYSISAGSLNGTNPTARYRLPANIHLTDDQIKAINKNENGITAGFSKSDPEYRKYLGAVAIEGNRTPDELLKDGTQEYISAVVRAENIFENDKYLGQDLIFTFVPYTIAKNQKTFDKEEKTVSAGKEVTGWFACDFRPDQIDWIEEEIEEEAVEEDVAGEEVVEEGATGKEVVEEEVVREEEQEETDRGSADPAVTPVEKTAEILFVSEDKTKDIKEIKRTLKLVDTVSEEEGTEEENQEFQAGTLTADGDGYKITLDYTEEAKIPENASLSVREITAETDKEAYEACLAQAQQHVDESGEARSTVDSRVSRFFDIEIQVTNEDGTTQKIEPAVPVSVNIQIADAPAANDDTADSESGSGDAQHSDPTVLHFAEDGVEQIEATSESVPTESGNVDASEDNAIESKAAEVRFEAESFSIYGVVYTVDFHWEVDGKMYEFSLPGGGFVSFSKLAEVLGIISDKNSEENVDQNEAETAENEKESDTASSLTLGDVMVSDVAREFAADVESVEFSSPELVDVSRVENDTTVGQIKEVRGLQVQYSAELTQEQIEEINAQTVEAGDWALISVQPFTSEETMTVTMKDGEVFTIQVTDYQISTNVLTADGRNYKITVTYDDNAEIPSGTKLTAEEIMPGTDEYLQHLGKAWAEVNKDYLAQEEEKQKNIDGLDEYEDIRPVNLDDARFFNIRLIYGEKEIEPKAPVHVDIEYVEGFTTVEEEEDQVIGVAHYKKDETELITDVRTEKNEAGEIVEFVYEQDSFSDIGTYVGQKTYDNVPYKMSKALAMPLLRALTNATRNGTQLKDIEAHKKLTNNDDGTYTMSLTVKGDSVANEEYNKANILFVMDRSSSMTSNNVYQEYTDTTYPSGTTYYRKNGNNYEALFLNNGQVCTRTSTWTMYGWQYEYTPYTGTVYTSVTRLVAEQAAMDVLIQNLLGKNDSTTPGKEDLIEISVISFAEDRQSGDTEYTEWTSNDYTGLMEVVNQTNTPAGTNWEDALIYAREQAYIKKQSQPDEDVYVIFLTDGEPTAVYGEHSGAQHYKDSWGNVIRGGFDYALTETGTYEGPGKEDDDENSLDRAKEIVDDGYKFYGIFTFNPGEAQTKYLRRLMNFAYTGVDKAYENDETKEDTDIVKKYFTNADTPETLTAAFEKIFADVSSMLGHGDVVITDGLQAADAMTTTIHADRADGFRYSVTDDTTGEELYYVTATGSDSNPTVTFHIGDQPYPAGASKTGVDGKPYYSVTVNGTEYTMALADLSGRELTWDLSAIGTLLPGCTYKVDIIVWPNQAAYDYVAGLNNKLPGYSWDPSVESNPDNYHEVTVDGVTYGYYTGGVSGHDSIVKYKDSEVYSVLTNTHQELNYSIVNTKTNEVTGETTTTSDPQDPVPLEPQKPMDLVDTNSKIEKQWDVDLDPSILAQLLYPADGTHYTLTFDILQDTSTTPYKTLTLGWDTTQKKYVWESGSERDIEYNGTTYSIGTTWKKDFAVPTGLMLSEERMDELGMDKSAYPSGTYPVDPEDPDSEVKTYYLLENGHDYTIKERNLSYEFDFNSDVFHPMLVDGKMQNVNFTKEGMSVNISNMTNTIGGLSSLKVENTLRGYIHLEKHVVDGSGNAIDSDKTKFEYTISLTNNDGVFVGTHIPWYGINGLYYHDRDFNYYQVYYDNNQLNIKNEAGEVYPVINSYDLNDAAEQTLIYRDGGVDKELFISGNQTTPANGNKAASAILQICQGEVLSIANIPAGTQYEIIESAELGYNLVSIDRSFEPDDVEDNPEDTTINLGGRSINGKIVPNHHNYIEYTNRCLVTDISIQKVDEDGSGIEGAVFQLKTVSNNGYSEELATTIESIRGIGDVTKVVNGETKTYLSAFESTGGVQTFSGLPDGTYRLYEVYIPAGYISTFRYIQFTIDNRQMKNVTTDNGDVSMLDTTANNVDLKIANISGAELPHTGGPGTRLSTILGSILVAGAGLMLWRKRRFV